MRARAKSGSSSEGRGVGRSALGARDGSDSAPERPTPNAQRPTASHTPVMLPEVLKALAPRPGGLYLDATIGLAKRDAAAAEAAKLTTQDRRFLESLRIQVDQESFLEENDKKPVPRLAMTPQDVRFLKSLRIATDDVE